MLFHTYQPNGKVSSGEREFTMGIIRIIGTDAVSYVISACEFPKGKNKNSSSLRISDDTRAPWSMNTTEPLDPPPV
jgi:hypothetical protein